MLAEILDLKNKIVKNVHIEKKSFEINNLHYLYNDQHIILKRDNNNEIFSFKHDIIDINIDYIVKSNELIISNEEVTIRRFITKKYLQVDNLDVEIKKYNIVSYYKDKVIVNTNGTSEINNLLISDENNQTSIVKDGNNLVTIYQKDGKEFYRIFDNCYLYLNMIYVIPNEINIKYNTFDNILSSVVYFVIYDHINSITFDIQDIKNNINLSTKFNLFDDYLENIYLSLSDNIKIEYEVIKRKITVYFEHNNSKQVYIYDDISSSFFNEKNLINSSLVSRFVSFDDLVMFISDTF